MQHTPEHFNSLQNGTLPGVLGLQVAAVDADGVRATMAITPAHMAPNGFLHAASVIALADTTCGYGTRMLLPQGASNFTTIELKSNHLGTARSGVLQRAQCALHPQSWQSSTGA